MALYHSDVGNGIPDDVYYPCGPVYVNPSPHAQAEAQNDRYLESGETSLAIPRVVDVRDDNVFEVEELSNGLYKVGVRESYDDYRDIIYIILLDGGVNDPLRPCTLKTVWVNTVDDQHTTLDASVYDNA
jgi:hypothetical protein